MVDLKAFTAPLFFTIGPFNDIIELFKHIDWVKDSKNVGFKPYDFNENRKVDYDEVVLRNMVMSG